jgi:hypothetical protein
LKKTCEEEFLSFLESILLISNNLNFKDFAQVQTIASIKIGAKNKKKIIIWRRL